MTVEFTKSNIQMAHKMKWNEIKYKAEAGVGVGAEEKKDLKKKN